jgi:hypothetical protein
MKSQRIHRTGRRLQIPGGVVSDTLLYRKWRCSVQQLTIYNISVSHRWDVKAPHERAGVSKDRSLQDLWFPPVSAETVTRASSDCAGG